MNDHLALVCGASSTGKSLSLHTMHNPEGVMYLNCEGKKLPFKSKFQEYMITDPYQIYEAIEHAETLPDVHTIVIDTSTFLMDMYESQYVLTSTDGRKAWGDYATYFKTLLLDKIAKSTKNFIVLAHTRQQLNEADMVLETKVPIKGALANQGVEAYFSTIVATKKMSIKQLKDFKNKYLNITEEDELLGFKYVYQTRITKDTVNERIRSPLNMWSKSETYIDNNANFLMERLHEYYD